MNSSSSVPPAIDFRTTRDALVLLQDALPNLDKNYQLLPALHVQQAIDLIVSAEDLDAEVPQR